jgi:hypothetical protein
MQLNPNHPKMHQPKGATVGRPLAGAVPGASPSTGSGS